MIENSVHERYDNENGVYHIPDHLVNIFDSECDSAGGDFIEWIDIREKYKEFKI